MHKTGICIYCLYNFQWSQTRDNNSVDGKVITTEYINFMHVLMGDMYVQLRAT